MRTLFPLVVLLCCLGCSSVLNNKKEQQSIQAAEKIAAASSVQVVRAAVEAPPVNVTGNTIAEGASLSVVTQPATNQTTVATQGSQSAGASENQAFASSSKLPLSIALVIGSVGLLLLVLAVWLIRRGSAAANAAYTATDTGLAGLIDLLHSHAAVSTDPEKTALLTGLRAEVEKLRGKVAQ